MTLALAPRLLATGESTILEGQATVISQQQRIAAFVAISNGLYGVDAIGSQTDPQKLIDFINFFGGISEFGMRGLPTQPQVAAFNETQQVLNTLGLEALGRVKINQLAHFIQFPSDVIFRSDAERNEYILAASYLKNQV